MRTLSKFLIIILFMGCGYDRNQANEAIAHIPSFQMQLLDSNTIVNSSNILMGRPTILLYFRTDCHYCQEETKIIMQNKYALKDAQIYFLTASPLDQAKWYSDYFGLSGTKNIIVARDYNHSFAKIFNPKGVPLIVIYDKRKRLTRLYNGQVSIANILKASHIQ